MIKVRWVRYNAQFLTIFIYPRLSCHHEPALIGLLSPEYDPYNFFEQLQEDRHIIKKEVHPYRRHSTEMPEDWREFLKERSEQQ